MKNRRTFLKNTTLGALSLGVTSMLKLENTTNIKSTPLIMCDPTTKDFYGEGPFYTDNPPMIDNTKLAGPNEPGQTMIISGRVLNLDCNEFIPDTVIDVWHANDAGQYDNQGYTLRGFTTTNEEGFYVFETIKPGKYLNGSSFRPSHIHFKITPPGFPTLITQLYFDGDTSIDGDAAASIDSGTYDASNRIIELSENEDGILEGQFDITINGEGIAVGTNDIHLDKGMIYSASPNPFMNEVEIKYGVFKSAKVGLVVFDANGRQIALLEDQPMEAEKYTSIWEPDSFLPSGHYFIALRVNELQVHYVKVVKV
ncbi:MAG: T9SS type A sorting domain-containing protein [Saprospiraceae bacterium]|nr:T9SS type A sorting domain-containing protein [Saprospiraceae bacterium]